MLPKSPQFLLLFLILLLARPQVQAQFSLNGRANRQLQEMVEFNEVFAQGHTGFCLYDLETETYLYGLNADRRFVPASNVKLLTLFLVNRILGHRAPGLFYQEYQDRIEAWGTGYPLTLHPEFVGYDELGPWLSAREKPLVFNFPVGEGGVPRYGKGWSWDDYNDAYVYEQSALPLFGNQLFLDLSPVDSLGRQLLLGSPPGLTGSLRQLNEQETDIRRSEFANDFTLGPAYSDPGNFPIERPLHLSPRLLMNELITAYPNLELRTGKSPYPAPGDHSTLTISLPDTILRRLMINSDNFLAEQLLLQAATHRYGVPDKARLIDFARDSLLTTLGIENIRWVDGSGLSRYNLLTPRHLTRLLTVLNGEIGQERLLSILPAGGVSGTLKNRFDDQSEVYVWAKTGSLSGVTSVSGFLRTARGRWLVFSFMHNNYVGSSRPFYGEMEKVLSWCRTRL